MRNTKVLSFLFLLLMHLYFVSQTIAQQKKEVDIDQLIQELFPNPTDADNIGNYDDVYESLYQLYTTPLNLNQADREELAFLYLLSEAQINSLLAYRQTYGKLLSIYELQAIPNFDLATIEKILPFVEVAETDISKDAQPLWKRILHERDNHYLLWRSNTFAEEKQGFTPPPNDSTQRYQGDPFYQYLRYRVQHPRDFSLGFTLEKDAGEANLDFFSFHAYFEQQGKWKKIIIGDYQLGFGQNILFAAGFQVGKGTETVSTLRRSHIGIRPFTSTLEMNFLRGVAFTYQWNNIEITPFYSLAPRDANLVEETQSLDSLEEEAALISETFISSLRLSGLHRTPAEIAAKHTLLEQIWGMNLLYQNKTNTTQWGITFAHTSYNIPLQRTDKIYNRFEFNGQENYNISLQGSHNWQNFNFFGEAAWSKSGGKALVLGYLASLSPKVDMGFLIRHFDKDFHSLYGNAFNENTRNINETGIYWGLKIRPIARWEISAYYDYFVFPYLRFNADAPSLGYEYLLQLQYKPIKKVTMTALMRNENKQQNQTENNTTLNFLTFRNIQNYVFTIDYAPSKMLSLKTRLQVNTVEQGGQYGEGIMLFQDIGFDEGKWHIDARFALFDDQLRRKATNNYGATYLYVYEKNVLWAPTMVRYSGSGVRYMLMIRYRINRVFDASLRIAQVQREDTDAIGSGLEQINTNRSTFITCQLKINL
ncbi:MAG: helix-hairpin-helix domain-containing protein [Cytophagales bacterium]|nr:MAG: helix-hairpin-helix domain-containing protein [Cytophagales bacterium]